MTWTGNLYPPRLFSIERRAIRQRIIVVVKRRRDMGETWAELIARAA